jgi:hypothetical protein
VTRVVRLRTYLQKMHTPISLPIHTASHPLSRLADLVAAARARRRSPNGLRDAVARRVRFLRAAATTQTTRIRTLVARDRDTVAIEVCAMAHVLRIRSRLTADEQRGFDEFVRDYTETMLGMVVNRSEDDALESVRRHLGSVSITMP